MAGIASGAFSEELLDAAYRQALAIESGERVVVGVNRYPAASEPLEVFRIDPAVEATPDGGRWVDARETDDSAAMRWQK